MKHAQKLAARHLIKELRELVPPLLPVRVHFREIVKDGYLGTTTIMYTWNGAPKHFLVVIDKNLEWDLMKHVIIHEWAHTMSWAHGETICDHDPEWGLAMSRIYQEVIEP